MAQCHWCRPYVSQVLRLIMECFASVHGVAAGAHALLVSRACVNTCSMCLRAAQDGFARFVRALVVVLVPSTSGAAIAFPQVALTGSQPCHLLATAFCTLLAGSCRLSSLRTSSLPRLILGSWALPLAASLFRSAVGKTVQICR